jgi:recombination protein RecA
MPVLTNEDALKDFGTIVPILQHHLESDIFVSEEIQEWPRLNTGFLVLNHILGGGLPKGCIIEVFGPESLGKSTLAAQWAAAHQRSHENARVLYLDFEQTMDTKRLAMLGCKVERPHMFLAQPRSIEEGLLLVKTFVMRGIVDFIVWDTVAASQPAAVINAQISDAELKRGMKDIDEGKVSSRVAIHALVFSSAVATLNPVIAEHGAIMVFPNQERTTINTYGSGSTTSGGRALKYYASCRIRMSKSDTIKESVADDVLGTKQSTPVELAIQFHVVKNKAAPPFRKGIIRCDIRQSGRGFMEAETIFDLGVKRKVIEKSGASFTFPSGTKIKGTDNAVKGLRSSQKEMDALRNALLNTSPAEDEETYEEVTEDLPEGVAEL